MKSKNWYVYKITFSDGLFYIGWRGTTKSPKEDFLKKYFSSSKVVKEKIKSCDFRGEILLESNDKEFSYHEEQRLIHEHLENPLILNQVCYHDRGSFGLLSKESREKIGEKSKANWANEDFRTKICKSQNASWTDERRESYIEITKAAWTPERKANQSAKLSGRPGHKKCKGIPKPAGHGANVSAALKGKPKSAEHCRKLAELRRRLTVYVCRIDNRQEMTVGCFNKWLKGITARELKTRSKSL